LNAQWSFHISETFYVEKVFGKDASKTQFEELEGFIGWVIGLGMEIRLFIMDVEFQLVIGLVDEANMDSGREAICPKIIIPTYSAYNMPSWL